MLENPLHTPWQSGIISIGKQNIAKYPLQCA
nr:MAG TPA: hypothetical protein [Caudoviricetes sp.]